MTNAATTAGAGQAGQSHLPQLFETHPRGVTLSRDAGALLEAIGAAFDCAQTCTACADACLAEPDVQAVVHCIRLNLDCADVCTTTGRVLARQTEPDLAVVRAQLQACVVACRACGAECRTHAHHQHCQVCADACRRCEQACDRLAGALAP